MSEDDKILTARLEIVDKALRYWGAYIADPSGSDSERAQLFAAVEEFCMLCANSRTADELAERGEKYE